MRALVVFHDFGTHPLARFLKPGFKHCFVAIEADGNWITLDGRAGLPVVEIVAPADYDLATFYRSRGYAVIETEQRCRVPLTPFLPRNCVGLVKGILAIGAVMAITPWQLYMHLARAESPGLQLLPGKSDTGPDKPGKFTVAVKGLKNLGRDGDTELAHVTPAEKRMLKKKGGSGTINPKTGLREFFGGEGGGGSMGRDDGRVGGGNRDDGRGNRGRGRRDRSDVISGGGGSDTVEHDPVSAVGDSQLDGASVTIERRKKATNFKDISGREDQRDGALLLNVTVDDGGELGGGSGSKATPSKEDDKRGGRAATLLSASKGIRDKLGRSGRRAPGKSLG